MRCFSTLAAAVFLPLGISGCSASSAALRGAPPAALDQPDEIRFWLERGDPSRLTQLVDALHPKPSEDDDPCPLRRPSERSLTLLGGCRDREDRWWSGTAEYDLDRDGYRAKFEHFGRGDSEVHGKLDAKFEASLEYHLDVVVTLLIEHHPRFEDVSLRYSGVAARKGTTTVYDGSGKLAAPGHGKVDIRTHGVRTDAELCRREPLSGQIELRAGKREAALVFDGEDACDGRVRWTLDGIERGMLEVDLGERGCSMARPESAAPWFLLGLLAIARRRRRA